MRRGIIAAAYWFTSSTSFANPAITVGRTLSDTFAGIAPASVSGFVALQVVVGAVGLAAVLLLDPNTPELAVDLTVPAPASLSQERLRAAGSSCLPASTTAVAAWPRKSSPSTTGKNASRHGRLAVSLGTASTRSSSRFCTNGA